MSVNSAALTEENSSLKFLFIDDNKLVRKSIERSFKAVDANVDLRLCPNLECAEERLKQGDQFDMIWVDFRLSRNGSINGADWVEAVAGRYPKIVFVIYTSFGGDPAIVKKVDSLYKKHPNFELFIEEKGSHDKLMQFYRAFVDQFLGVPPAFLRLIENLEKKIESSKNYQCFLEGEAYHQYQIGLIEIREKLKGNLEKFPNELLQRQYEKLSQEWYILLKEYHPQSPDKVNIWNRVNYYHFFRDEELKPHLDKLGISAFRVLQTVFNLYKLSGSENEEQKTQLLEKQKKEEEFFKRLILATPQGESVEWNRLKTYLKLRKEDIEQELSPEILYEVANRQEALLKPVLEDWKEHKSVKRLEKLLNPTLLTETTVQEEISQVMDVVSRQVPPELKPDPKWEKSKDGYGVCGGQEVLTILPERCAVIFCESKIPKNLLKKLWDKYPEPIIDTLSLEMPVRNLSALLESLVLGRNDSTPQFTQTPLLIVGSADYLDKIREIVTFWSQGEYIVALESNMSDIQTPYHYWSAIVHNNCMYWWEFRR